MADYIERAAAVTACDKQYRECLRKSDFCGDTVAWNICADIKAIPAADVAPVVHGRWDDSGRYTFPSGDVAVRCTNCGCALTKSEYRLYTWNYCPICGAKMDGGDNDAKSV